MPLLEIVEPKAAAAVAETELRDGVDSNGATDSPGDKDVTDNVGTLNNKVRIVIDPYRTMLKVPKPRNRFKAWQSLL